ncbi:hypothetical protein LTS18_000829 [Coniosporium uncinatum]|uniref:Uncharacterized protein n=1 Tax=Coniosporium uncinatum TaxID=93489 RepID=A0ACC3DUY0_9PEZI|nr:hypothetical protein LTS18_000829 [Coniosporium uncinatum]
MGDAALRWRPFRIDRESSTSEFVDIRENEPGEPLPLPLLCWPLDLQAGESRFFRVCDDDQDIASDAADDHPQAYLIKLLGSSKSLAVKLDMVVIRMFTDDDLWATLGEARAEIEASGDDKRILLRRVDKLRTNFRNIDAHNTHRVTDILQVVKKEILCPKATSELVDAAIAQLGFVENIAEAWNWIKRQGAKKYIVAFVEKAVEYGDSHPSGM